MTRTRIAIDGAARLCADRWAERALALVAAAHLVLFALFVLSLASAADALSQPRAACQGEDLVAALRRSDPERLEAAVAEAASVVNGNAIFWKVEKPGLAPSFLLGTMHSADPRVTRMPEGAGEAFAAASTVIIENTQMLDPEAMKAAMIELKDYTFLTDGSTLDEFVAPGRLGDLQSAVEARAMPWMVARHMQPWLIAAAIAIPVCEVEAKNAGAPVLDSLIGHRARAEGKQLVGLETIEEQFAAVSSIPRDFHVNALNETLGLGTLADSMMETTKLLYLEGNTALLLSLIRAYAPKTYAGKGYAAFQERLIARRNRLMVERAAAYLDRGNAFMAVGALHLPGGEGLVALLRARGFRLVPAAG